MSTTNKFVSEIAKLKPQSTFLTVKGYRNSSSEVADYSIVFNINYTNALKRSIATLEAMSLSNDLERQAREELLASYNKSLIRGEEETIEERTDAYQHFQNDDGSYIRGVKWHTATSTLHLYGLINAKRVLLPGIYPKVNSRPLTIAKHKLSSLCSVGKFRQFKLTEDNVEYIAVQNMTLLPPE